MTGHDDLGGAKDGKGPGAAIMSDSTQAATSDYIDRIQNNSLVGSTPNVQPAAGAGGLTNTALGGVAPQLNQAASNVGGGVAPNSLNQQQNGVGVQNRLAGALGGGPGVQGGNTLNSAAHNTNPNANSNNAPAA